MGQFKSLVGVSAFERDPRALPILACAHGGLFSRGTEATTSATFWDDVDAMGDYQTSSPATGTRTLVNVTSGRGALRGIIGPTGSNASTHTVTITIDGTAYTIALTQPALGRFVFGDCTRLLTQYTTANHSGGIDAALTARGSSNIIALASNGSRTLLAPMEIPRFIKFDVSLKVEWACSAVGGVANADYCGAIWNLDG